MIYKIKITNENMMDNEKILLLSFCSFVSSMLFCLCIKYCKDGQREMNEKIHIKKLHERLKRKNIIKPIIDSGENFNEEVKDENENNFRTTEIITNEDNV